MSLATSNFRPWALPVSLLACAVCLASAVEAAPLSRLRSFWSGGNRCVSLQDLASHYGYAVSIPPGRKVYLRSKWNTLEFENDSRMAVINGTAVWLHAPMQKKSKGKWAVAETDIQKIIDPVLRPDAYLGSQRYHTIVLDPGHGGTDDGARGHRSLVEKLAVLDIAKRVRVHLSNEGLKVYMTRETDKAVSLDERSAKARKWGANLYVSIHLNSAVSSKARGVETYSLAMPGYPSTAAEIGSKAPKSSYSGNNYNVANTILGYYMQRSLVAKTGSLDRGLRRARFQVLRDAPCPAALVECGFVSNSIEEGKMIDDKHRDRIAQGIAKGILDYIAAVKRARVASSGE